MEEQPPPPPPVRPVVSTALSGSPHPGAPSAAGTPGGTSSAATAAAVLSFSTTAAAALGNQSDGSGGDSTGIPAGGGLGGRGAPGAAGRLPLGPEAAPLLSHGAAVAAQALVLLLIFLLSSLGNCAVMGVIVKHRQLRTVTNAFILSLSLSDLLTALLCLPAAFLDLFTPPGGPAPAAAAAAGPWRGFCASSRFFSSCFGIVSTLSVALISLDRYCAIVRPPREKIGRRRALQLLAGAWLAALGFSLPWELFRAPQGPPAAQSFHGCLYRTSPDPAQLGAAYSVGLVVACYLLPFLLMCFCHYHICKTVRLSDLRVRPLTTYARVLRFFSDVRTATTVLIMIVFVICCWGPYCFLVLLAAARQAQATQAPSFLNVVAVWLTWANGAINPVIYAIRNPNISMLLGRSREEGYRTRNVDAFLPNQGRALQARSRNRLRNRCTNRLGACSRTSSSKPTSAMGGDVAMWARKNPVVLFCREGPPEAVTAAAKQPKSVPGDTSL
ncbi:G-protein coupled receptor 135 [Camelus ferus]|uniref:G-protein coupled receptor 135 n=1 Tax=Camelus ferus TaxID=419612 RepID=A0A8B8T7J9_CAMFR|nr:G-protein coupled receptor 135 [Camelus ferus]XP_032338014.1 G-protein coupled receptor 135 [Camelus ferus]XP_032338015.1 G-protein coupled receptor 135 [Camelus ferus]XP_032338016.1 G-protein coupled receptor 135 [Camelus ferus]XP_032338017.1 G-protein coupled receptor 135 [Camelus ferus]XP_032338018.1 G-protein coupled receptor 135 [Camelus ferus]XP_032338019.1 G-protein coupled receptor 135 [Camelus ferus]